MGRDKPPAKTEAVILPPELDDDDEECGGGGIPDDDGWVHLKRKEAQLEDEKPKRRPARRRSQGSG